MVITGRICVFSSQTLMNVNCEDLEYFTHSIIGRKIITFPKDSVNRKKAIAEAYQLLGRITGSRKQNNDEKLLFVMKNTEMQFSIQRAIWKKKWRRMREKICMVRISFLNFRR